MTDQPQQQSITLSAGQRADAIKRLDDLLGELPPPQLDYIGALVTAAGGKPARKVWRALRATLEMLALPSAGLVNDEKLSTRIMGVADTHDVSETELDSFLYAVEVADQ